MYSELDIYTYIYIYIIVKSMEKFHEPAEKSHGGKDYVVEKVWLQSLD